MPHPQRWWHAARTDLPWLTDPDLHDGHVRHADKDERSWAVIAGVVENIGRAVAASSYDVELTEPTGVIIPLPPTQTLDDADATVVRSWFRADSEAPCADPWDQALTNGHHRLWGAWQAAPDALLPIYSDVLGYLEDVPHMGLGLARAISQTATDGLRHLPARIATRNPRYVQARPRGLRQGQRLRRRDHLHREGPQGSPAGVPHL